MSVYIGLEYLENYVIYVPLFSENTSLLLKKKKKKNIQLRETYFKNVEIPASLDKMVTFLF